MYGYTGLHYENMLVPKFTLIFFFGNIIKILAFSQDGGWSAWSKIQTPCIKSETNQTVTLCGGGVRIRYRSCTLPVPQGEGKYCEGDDTKYDKCNEFPCQLPEEYLWSAWSKCSKTCGRGIRKRYTMCGSIRKKPMTSLLVENFETTIEPETTTNSDLDTTETTTVSDTTTMQNTMDIGDKGNT